MPLSQAKAWVGEVMPTYEGLGGQVFQIAEPDLGDDPRAAGYIVGSSFVIFAPNAHLFWDWHAIFTVALVPIEGLDPPRLHYPGAEYEVMCWALDPEAPVPDPRSWPLDPDAEVRPKFLSPPDAIVQFHGPNLDQVTEMMGLVGKAVAEGLLVPDSDHRERWTRIIRSTAEHYSGEHD